MYFNNSDPMRFYSRSGKTRQRKPGKKTLTYDVDDTSKSYRKQRKKHISLVNVSL